uniref:Uncharacterized protein n=1 Tax=Romanomermis culicivorax TaxID=13658 RepID=A0A915HT82_ROMCU
MEEGQIASWDGTTALSTLGDAENGQCRVVSDAMYNYLAENSTPFSPVLQNFLKRHISMDAEKQTTTGRLSETGAK